MTTTEALNKVSNNSDWDDFTYVLDTSQQRKIMSIFHKAAQLYAKQFIDAANEIIGPACDVLDENYDEEYENWHTIQEINEVIN